MSVTLDYYSCIYIWNFPEFQQFQMLILLYRLLSTIIIHRFTFRILLAILEVLVAVDNYSWICVQDFFGLHGFIYEILLCLLMWTITLAFIFGIFLNFNSFRYECYCINYCGLLLFTNLCLEFFQLFWRFQLLWTIILGFVFRIFWAAWFHM